MTVNDDGVPPPPERRCAVIGSSPGDVSLEDFYQAMRLLGLDPTDNERALISVHIEAGRITAELAQVRHVRLTPSTDGI